jgi:hypothetical protein
MVQTEDTSYMKLARRHLPRRISLFVNFYETLEKRLMFTAALPELPAVVAPASNPALPSGFDTFVPPATLLTPTAGAPGIAGATNSASPGDTIAVSDVNISALPASDKDSDSEFVTYGQTTASNGQLVEDTIQQLGPNTASVTLASDNTPNSMYFLWAGNANGFSAPVAINKTDAMWVGPNQATAGQTISVYGQNLTFTATDGKSWVYITQSGSNSGQWASVVSANPYCVTFVVPQNLSGGNYQVWVHNGHGGVYGWSSPVTLTVNATVAASTQVFNVLNYGAVGNGVTDDTTAFNAAISAASKYPGATVYVPTGSYVISQITIGNLQLVGDGQGKSVLLGAPTSSPSVAMVWLNSNTQISNLTLDSNNVGYSDLMYGRFRTNLQFTDVTFNANQTQYFDIHADNLVFFTGCNMIGDGAFLGTASQLFFNGCNFYGTNDANSLLYSWGGTGISITDCTAQDYNNSDPDSGAGWAKGRFFVASPEWGPVDDIYIADNTTIALGVRPTYFDQNVGEQLLFEGNNIYSDPGAAFVGATQSSVTLSGLPSSFSATGYEVIIMGGDGVGEHLPIASYNAATGLITLDGTWAVVPDSTSIVRLGMIDDGVVIYQNSLSGKGSATTTASAGVEFWGGAIDAVVASNTINNVDTGIFDDSLDFGGNSEPDYWNLYQSNTITNSVTGIVIANDGTGGQAGAFGDIARSNQITNMSNSGFAISDDNATQASEYYVILEDNTITNAKTAVWIVEAPYIPVNPAAVTQLLLVGNTFVSGADTPAGAAAVDVNETADITQDGNTFENYPQSYAGDAASALLQPVFTAPSDNLLSVPANVVVTVPTGAGSTENADTTSSSTSDQSSGTSNESNTNASTSQTQQARKTSRLSWVAVTAASSTPTTITSDDLKKLHQATAILASNTHVLAA